MSRNVGRACASAEAAALKIQCHNPKNELIKNRTSPKESWMLPCQDADFDAVEILQNLCPNKRKDRVQTAFLRRISTTRGQFLRIQQTNFNLKLPVTYSLK